MVQDRVVDPAAGDEARSVRCSRFRQRAPALRDAANGKWSSIGPMEVKHGELAALTVELSAARIRLRAVPRLFLLACALALLLATSYLQPWMRLLESPQIRAVERAELRAVPARGRGTERVVALPHAWRAGAIHSRQKIYSFSFDAPLAREGLALLLPAVRDRVELRLNGAVLLPHEHTRVRLYWLWNRPLLYRFPAAMLADANTVELRVTSAGSKRAALSKLYLGSSARLEDIYTLLRAISYGIPMAAMVLMACSAMASAAYALVGGRLYWLAALFNASAALSMLNWLVAAPVLAPHTWLAVSAFCKHVALGSLLFFLLFSLRLSRWFLLLVALATGPILLLSGAAMLGENMDRVCELLERAEAALMFGGVVLFGVGAWLACAHTRLHEQAFIWGVLVCVALGLRDGAVQLGVLPFSMGQHLPLGFLVMSLTMVFVFVRMAFRHMAELDGYRAAERARQSRREAEFQALRQQRTGLEMAAIVGRLSIRYSRELRNPIGDCLASGNLALKREHPGYQALGDEARQVVSSSLACSELLERLVAMESGVAPTRGPINLPMPAWLGARLDEISRATGAEFVVAQAPVVQVLAQPQTLLQALTTMLCDVCDNTRRPPGEIGLSVSQHHGRARLLFSFTAPGLGGYWSPRLSAANALLKADNASLELLYDADQRLMACAVNLRLGDALPAPDQGPSW